MKWLRRSALVFLVLAALVALVPFFITLDDYIPAVEKELSARLEEQVSIDSLRASLLPVPHFVVEGISIGNEDEVKVSRITLKPDLWSLLTSQKVIRSAELEEVALSQKALGALVALAQRDTGASGIRVESIRLRGAVVKLQQSSFGPFDGEVQVRGAGQQGEVTLATRDGAFQARITPQGERYALAISAKSWTSPLGPPIRFDTLNVKGAATATGADLTEIEARLYGGKVTGTASLAWRDGVTLKGALDVKQVELKDLAPVVSPKMRLTGRLDARPVFNAHAQQAAQLDEALRIETPFEVRGGVLHGVDLAGAVLALAKQGASGGETRFDELAGHLVAERGTYRFTQLRISSGVFSARGHVTVAPSKALSGQLNTSVKGGAAANIPLTVAGTLGSPMVYPNTTALIGAAAGTAVLGPGLGTAAGAKLGEIAEGLFGKKKR